MVTALVTGGTSGIGAAFARALARSGHDLVLVGRDASALDAARRELSPEVGVEVLRADLAVREDVERVAERLRDPDRPVEVLVNNAGLGVRGSMTGSGVHAQEHALDVMCRAVLVLSAAAGEAMRGRGSGRIINVASVAGFLAMGGYSAVKAWVTTWSESLAVELRGTGVTVTALCPGWVRTDFHARAAIGTSSIPGPLWIDADALVARALHDAERGRVVSVPTRRWQLLVGLVRHAPRPVVLGVSDRLTRHRRSTAGPAPEPVGGPAAAGASTGGRA